MAQNGVVITLMLDDNDPQPNGLSLITPLKDFEQQVRVLTSTDGQLWEPPIAQTVIFDYSRFMDVRNDKVSFETTARRHFRIVIDDVTAKQQSELMELTRHLHGDTESERTEKVLVNRRPFRIDRIDFWQDAEQEQARADRKQEYPVAAQHFTEDPKTKRTLILIDTRREPLTSLGLQTTSKNFSRHCTVEIEQTSGVVTAWKQIAEATLSRIDFQSFHRGQLAIEFPETRQARYRLAIENRDSAPLEISGIKAEGNVYELVILSPDSRAELLLYGDSDAGPPNYDTATIQTLLNEGHRYAPVHVTMGIQEKAKGVAPPGFKWTQLVNDPRVLTSVICLLVVVLGRSLYRAMQRIDH